MQQVLKNLLRNRRFGFPVERAAYSTVLHRIFESGFDRGCKRWKRDVRIPGTEAIELHQLYRAMRRAGESKDSIEEALFQHRRDLFTEVTLAFFDTTSIYFEGRGGESLGTVWPFQRSSSRSEADGCRSSAYGRGTTHEL